MSSGPLAGRTLREEVYAGRALTPRELEALADYADGLTAAEAGRRRHLAATTVTTHRKNAIAKLAARNGMHAVAIALRRGLIT